MGPLDWRDFETDVQRKRREFYEGVQATDTCDLQVLRRGVSSKNKTCEVLLPNPLPILARKVHGWVGKMGKGLQGAEE